MSKASRRIDAHQHFWSLSRGDYGWLTPALEPIYRDFAPSDLEPLLAAAEIDGTVLVQAAPTEAETRYLLSLAESHAFIEGVVGWADFAAADASERINNLARNGKLKGLRPMIQDIDDVDWMLRPELDQAFLAMVEHDLVFDALVLPRHLDNLLKLLGRHPDLRAVIDHCAKPNFRREDFADWAKAMSTIAVQSTAFCKISGLVTEAGAGWTVDMLRPHFEHVLAAFGPQRLVWGSDWPVCTLAASYVEWTTASEELLRAPSIDERDAIFGGNARRLYRLG